MAEYENDPIYKLVKLSRKIRPMAQEINWTIPNIFMKLSEEIGEYSEAVSIETGLKTHKKAKYEHPFEEASDAIQCIIDALANTYPEKSPSEICTILFHYFELKGIEWERVMKEKHEKVKITKRNKPLFVHCIEAGSVKEI